MFNFHPKGPVCQSCGMPLDKKHSKFAGGTNSDGTVSREYCYNCYQNGEFVHKDVNAIQFQIICVEAMKKQGIPGFLAKYWARVIPGLKRWKS